MPSMPGYFVGKGYQFLMLDEQFGGDEANFMAAYDAALSRIDQPLSQLAETHATRGSGVRDELKQGDVKHFERHWLADWWPGKRVEEVLRAGYREAIQRAKDAGKPIESLWVCADEDRFQVYICEGPRQITVLVFTPPPKERAHEPVDKLTEDEPIWVVKVHDKDDERVKAKGGGSRPRRCADRRPPPQVPARSAGRVSSGSDQRAGAPKKPRWMIWASVSSTASSSRTSRRDASA